MAKAAAETKLGIKLPSLLREFYLHTAKREDINYAVEVLVSVDRLYFKDDYLVFYEENQCVCFWGISRDNLGDKDPTVAQGWFTSEDTDDADWTDSSEDHALPLSEFLLSMLIMQMQVEQGPTGIHRYSRCNRNSVMYPTDWNHCVSYLGGKSDVYWKPGSMILLSTTGKTVGIAGLGRTEADLMEIAETFGIEWRSD